MANILNKQDFEPNENTENGRKTDVDDKTTCINSNLLSTQSGCTI